jgi:PST family polysaccharide transporter
MGETMVETERRDPLPPAAAAAPPGGPRESTVGNRAVSHGKWIVPAPIVAKGVGLVATMVLARLLVPAQFGVMAFAGTALAFVAVFQDLGITQALISYSGEIEERLRPALVLSVGSGLVFYLALAALAYPLAAFVAEPLIGPVLLVLGSVVPLQALGQVQHALLVRGERYRALFFIALAQALTYVGVAVGLALAGFGVWSLVFGHVAAQLVRSLSLWMLSTWRPFGRGARGKLWSVGLVRFGGTLTVVNVLDWAADGWVFLTIGKLLGSESLGLYNLSFEAARMAYFGLPALAASVVLTSYSSLLDDPVQLRRLMLKGLRVVHGLAFPIAACIAALAPWIVPLVWGGKWDGAVPLLAVMALLGFSAPLGNVLLPYFVSSGKLRFLLTLTLVRLVLYAIVITVAAGFGLRAVAVAHLLLMWAVAGTILFVTARNIAATAADLRSALLWPALRAGACGLVAGAVARGLDGLHPAWVLAPALAAGAAVYAAIWFTTDREGFFETVSVVARGTGVIRDAR